MAKPAESSAKQAKQGHGASKQVEWWEKGPFPQSAGVRLPSVAEAHKRLLFAVVRQASPELLRQYPNARAFFYAILQGFADRWRPERSRGRPANPRLQSIRAKAATLRLTGKTWGQVALKTCPDRNKPNHTCNKRCADRIRQLAKPFLKREKSA